MPNLWTKTTQKLQEIFNGPRSKDVEFENKINEYKIFYQGLINLKCLLESLPNIFNSIKLFSTDISQVLKILYTKDSPYKEHSDFSSEVHNEIVSHVETFKLNVSKLVPSMIDLVKGDEIISQKLKVREEKRKDYDHYDEKLVGLYAKLKKDKAKMSKKEEDELHDKISRNEAKYKEATDKYLEQSTYCFKVIQNFIDTREKEIGPILCSLLYEEKLLFGSIFKTIKKLDNFDKSIYELLEKFSNKKTPITYDPEKYLRNGVSNERDSSDQNRSKSDIGKLTVTDIKNKELKKRERLQSENKNREINIKELLPEQLDTRMSQLYIKETKNEKNADFFDFDNHFGAITKEQNNNNNNNNNNMNFFSEEKLNNKPKNYQPIVNQNQGNNFNKLNFNEFNNQVNSNKKITDYSQNLFQNNQQTTQHFDVNYGNQDHKKLENIKIYDTGNINNIKGSEVAYPTQSVVMNPTVNINNNNFNNNLNNNPNNNLFNQNNFNVPYNNYPVNLNSNNSNNKITVNRNSQIQPNVSNILNQMKNKIGNNQGDNLGNLNQGGRGQFKNN